jgi:hypothetical protein
MKEIYVNTSESYDYPYCPLRGDRNDCGAVKDSEVNSCPILSEEDVWSVPEWCPVANGGVCIKPKE